MSSSNAIKPAPDLETSLQGQAKVRLKVGLPVVFLGLLTVWFWGTPYGSTGLVAVGIIATLHIFYIFTALHLVFRSRLVSAGHLVMATAILDPLILTAWIGMVGEIGAPFICFYLFTILGFGFRIGPKPMLVCQITSILGLSAVLTLTPAWREHPLIGLSFLALIIVVPIYAKILIKKLRDARAHAERESQAKSELLAKVSHELRTPLSGIVASAQLIEAETQDKSIAKRAETILDLSKELLLEINDLLDSAKQQANSLVLESELFYLTDVTDQLHLALASTAAAKGIGFNINMDEGIRDMVRGDSHYLKRVLMNIAGNAVKFTEQGKVDVHIKLIENGENYYRIWFGIQDTGIGIAQEMHASIFEPFFQASAGTTRRYGGTGLGMSIAKELVGLMKGNLQLESELGQGSLFYFDLKLPRVAKLPEQQEPKAAVPIVYGKRILIADDNATNLLLIKELLERDRHLVTVASSGQEALEALNLMDLDLVFLDYNMGDIDGAKVLQIYRFGKINTAPVFFLTADTTAETAKKLVDAGAAGILQKPVSGDGLRMAIAQVFEKDLILAPSKPAQVTLKPVATQYIDHNAISDLQALCPRPEFLVEVLESAAQDIQRNCALLMTALKSEDIKQVHDSAHALKGVAQSVGAVRLTAMATKLMKATHWELKPAKDRWKEEMQEAETQSVLSIQAILADQAASFKKQ
jgi:two-component system, sensor histidine kinase RpfC